MTYTIAQASKKSGLSPHTLRYYDKEGLLPFVGRAASGNRLFSETDLEWLELITCLKNTGMPVRDIKTFIDWYIEGDATIAQRHNLFIEHKKRVQEQIAVLKKYMKKIDRKVWYYQTALEAGTTSIHQKKGC